MPIWPFVSKPTVDSAYCTKQFPELWSNFVHTVIDTLHADGPTVNRPKSHPPPPPTKLPAAERLVAIGDLHGDLQKARRAFRLAGLVDTHDRWIGGTTVAVQVGDILDRGDQEIEIFYFLERLQQEAAAAGGSLHVLNGNHETMNVAQHFRYATPGGYYSFAKWAETHALEAALIGKCGCHPEFEELRKAMHLRGGTGLAARSHALQPGGPIATRFIAPHPVVLQIGSTVFVHGGLLPQHVSYGIERINQETQSWILNGPIHAKPKFLTGREAIVWARDYSQEDPDRCDCGILEKALQGVPGAERVVVGHTIQSSGINSACGGRVFRIDVGLSKGCGDGAPEVLEIVKDREVRRLREASFAKVEAKAAAMSA